MSIVLERKDAVALVTIDRVKQLNALNVCTLHQLELELTELNKDKSVKVIVLTGAGNRAFVAGADIEEMKDMNEKEAYEFSALGHRVFALVETMSKPVIAAVNGYALGGGCELALACDIRFASDKARFGQPEITLGIIPGFGGTRRLPRLVGRGKALEIILGGDMVDAETARKLGLVERVFPHDNLMEQTMEFATRVASFSLRAIQATKASVVASSDPGLNVEQELFAQLFACPDQVEGMSAFLERRPPEFKE